MKTILLTIILFISFSLRSQTCTDPLVIPGVIDKMVEGFHVLFSSGQNG